MQAGPDLLMKGNEMKTTQPILTDTTLLMMVRDELINPAGGIYPMLTMQAPFYEQAIVVDTGSKDGTRQLLEQLASEIPNLSVYDLPFEGFGITRNRAAKLVPTQKIMFLDADELVREADVAELARYCEANPCVSGVDLMITNVLPGWGEQNSGGWNPRLYKKEYAKGFDNLVYEILNMNGCVEEDMNARLLHFKPRAAGSSNKRDWYKHINHTIQEGKAPSDNPNFLTWKQPDPDLLEKYGIPYKESLAKLEELGLSPLFA
jgi:glycosyltransferase involved in cell wall biosynthesis